MELLNFKCHVCNTIVTIGGNIIRCNTCGNTYVHRDGKFYRENTYSKWAKKLNR